ncbi:MAG TPA: outer membrane beta-barrel protein [Nannocystaceae bacterium]|nr:outer membrane beta-barrel protein [Nannocystaceae bacterium]
MHWLALHLLVRTAPATAEAPSASAPTLLPAPPSAERLVPDDATPPAPPLDAAPAPSPSPSPPSPTVPAPAPSPAVPAPSPAAPAPSPPSPTALDATPAGAPFTLPAPGGTALTLAGYVETYYGYNFNRPSNGLTNFRAFDNRHNALTLQNVVFDAHWQAPRVHARLAFQFGQTPATYYLASEPAQAGTAGAAPSDPSVVRAIQQAYAGFRPFRRAPVFVEAGIFLSPIGFESLAIRDNWHWSYSPLFFALPFYHSGIHVGVEPAAGHALKAVVYNGWNNVIDNNREKSLGLTYDFTPGPRLALGAVYLAGVERPTGAPEGRPWRHVLNFNLKVAPLRRLALGGNLNGGVEPGAFGPSRWFASALQGRVQLFEWLYLAARGSYVREERARSAAGIAAPILLPYASDDPSQWFAAGTVTLDIRPVPDHLALKLEYRHDQVHQPAFFRGQVEGEGTDAAPFIANARAQDTLTLGLHAWF